MKTNVKGKTMSFGQFIKYVDNQKRELKRPVQKVSTVAGDGLVSNQKVGLRARMNNVRDTKRTDKKVIRYSTVSTVKQVKTCVPDLHDNSLFPSLLINEQGETVDFKPLSPNGVWSRGIQSIIDAKDLVPPEMLKKTQQRPRLDSYLDDDSVCSDDVYEDRQNDNSDSDDEWAEL